LNSTCKDCQNYVRREHFATNHIRKRKSGRSKPVEFVPPLDKNNRTILLKELTDLTSIELLGISMLTGDQCKVLFCRNGIGSNRCLEFQLTIGDDRRPFTVKSYTQHEERFIEYCALILKQQSVRLRSKEVLGQSELLFLSENKSGSVRAAE